IAQGDTPNSLTNKVPPGHHAACVDPAYGTLLGESIFPAKGHAGITTPYVSVSNFYRAQCTDRPDGRNYLAIAEARAPGDKRPSLVDLGKSHGGLGLHVYDFQFTQGDLIQLVRDKLQKIGGLGQPNTTSMSVTTPVSSSLQ